MPRLLNLTASILVTAGSLALAADKYSGPRPPKADILYLMHADTLIETEVGEAKEESRKGQNAAISSGASSPARTPLPEPVLLVKVDKLAVDKLAAYRYEVRNGNREVVIPTNKRKNFKPIYSNVTRLEDGLYKVEVDQILEPGEYCFSPDGSNQTFSFQVY